MDVFVAGGCSWDSVVYLDEFPEQTETHFARDFQETLGSSGSGKALNLGRLGVETRFHAMIGEDRFGEAIQERFAAEPVEFRFDDDPNGTERHINLMNDNGERISIFVVPPTREPEIDYERLEQWVATADALVVSPVNYTRHLLPAAIEADTNGAGDAFFAGYFYGHHQGEGVRTNLRLGTLAGGLAVSARDLAHPELSPDRLAAEYERRYGEPVGDASTE